MGGLYDQVLGEEEAEANVNELLSDSKDAPLASPVTLIDYNSSSLDTLPHSK